MTSQTNIDVRRYLRVFWRWKWLFALCVVLIPLGAYLVSSRQSKRFESAALLEISAPPVISLLQAPTTPPPASQVVAAAARLVQTTSVAQEAARFMHTQPRDPSALLGALSVAPDVNAGFLMLTASGASPARAADIANAFAQAVVARRAQATQTRYDTAIAQLNTEMSGFGRRDQLERAQLSQQLQQLRALKAAQDNGIQVVQPATASSSPVSPRPVRTTVLAFVVALLLGVGLILLAENLDRRVRRLEDIEEVTGLPLLASIPHAVFGEGIGAPRHTPQFEALRAALTYFNVDRPLRSVMITSPGQGDGKTSVASNLAQSFARAGRSVLLLDADLRRPQVAARFHVQSERGLGALLAGEASLEDVAVAQDFGEGRLVILPAGPPPPNPSELLASDRMRGLLAELVDQHDLVVVDTSPILAVSDALALVEQVSGIVVLARMGSTARDSLQRLQRVIHAARGLPLGVVATSARQQAGYGYGERYAYGDTPPLGHAPSVGAGRGPEG